MPALSHPSCSRKARDRRGDAQRRWGARLRLCSASPPRRCGWPWAELACLSTCRASSHRTAFLPLLSQLRAARIGVANGQPNEDLMVLNPPVYLVHPARWGLRKCLWHIYYIMFRVSQSVGLGPSHSPPHSLVLFCCLLL